jgi:hypothetical protein
MTADDVRSAVAVGILLFAVWASWKSLRAPRSLFPDNELSRGAGQRIAKRRDLLRAQTPKGAALGVHSVDHRPADLPFRQLGKGVGSEAAGLGEFGETDADRHRDNIGDSPQVEKSIPMDYPSGVPPDDGLRPRGAPDAED